jgi:hypothetical protein
MRGTGSDRILRIKTIFMKEILSEKLAGRLLLFMFSASLLFHLLVILQVIPFQMVWGGRLKDENEMIVFESFSVVVTIIMLLVVGMQAEIIKARISYKIIRVFLWIMTALFALNTLGKLNSVNKWERIIFTPVTFLLAILCSTLAIVKKKY